MNERKQSAVLDKIISVVYIALLIYSFIYGGKMLSTPDIPSGLTYLTIALLGVSTWFDVCDIFGFDFLIPNQVYIRRKQKVENQISKVIETYYGKDFKRYSGLLSTYFEKDQQFAESINEKRIAYFMNQIGISKKEFDSLLVELVRLQAMALKDTDDAVARIKYLLQRVAIIKQNADPANRVYPHVRYYIDFISIMRNDDFNFEIASTFACFIKKEMPPEDFKKIDKIIIPEDSNYLLGFRVGTILGIPQVIIRRKKGRIYENQPWDGNLKRNDRVIIIHDVLVTGNQVVDAAKKIKREFSEIEIFGLYCIVHRTDFDGARTIEQSFYPFKIVPMLQLDDSIIEKDYYREHQ